MAKKNHKPAKNNPPIKLYEPKTSKPSRNEIWLYGFHPVLAALKNPNRKIFRLLTTKEAAAELQAELSLPIKNELQTRQEIEGYLPEGAVHQGIAALTAPLPMMAIEDLKITKKMTVVLLDQITDPHNVGAIIRSAAAFDAAAVIMTDMNAPEISGTLAKSASGTLEIVPLITVTNLKRAMTTLKELGFWCVGMDGKAPETLREANLSEKVALVMGSEGFGLRRLTAENCDFMVRLPISSKVESLNVSNAAAIALYDLFQRR